MKRNRYKFWWLDRKNFKRKYTFMCSKDGLVSRLYVTFYLIKWLKTKYLALYV